MNTQDYGNRSKNNIRNIEQDTISVWFQAE